MGFYTTTLEPKTAPRKTPSCSSKTASRNFFSYPVKTSYKNRSNSLKTSQENPNYSYKTASGRSSWPSRDPIEESGGINLYGFVENQPVGRWDSLGLLDLNSVDLKKPIKNQSWRGIRALTGKLYHMKLDDGGKIEVWRADTKWHPVGSPANLPNRKPDPSNHLTWCHGVTFGIDKAPNGPFSMEGQEVKKVLRGDGWKLIKCIKAKKGDIAVWWRRNDIMHSAIIEQITPKKVNGRLKVDEKLSTLTEKRGSFVKKSGVSLISSAQEYKNSDYRCYTKPTKNGEKTSCIEKGEHESTLAWR